MIKKIKQNKFFTLAIILMLILIGFSFYSHYSEYYSYVPEYYKIKKNCYEGKNKDYENCKFFPTTEKLEKYIENNDPKKVQIKEDAITLTCTIVENTMFNCLQYLSPLLLAIAVLGNIHSEFNSGMFENYMLRMDYKKYLRKTYKIALMGALITPVSLILIFVLSSIFSGFNFDLSQVDTNLSVYREAKYSNFFLYGSIICLIQFFISLLYANISLYCCKKHKNTLVAIIMSYIVFLAVDIFIYIILYIFIINKLMGFKNLTDYFTITGFWYFNDSNCIIALIIAFILQLISFFILYYSYSKKDKVIELYEKQVS